MKVIGYIRVSTEQQVTSGQSLDAQRSKLDAYAKLYDLMAFKVPATPVVQNADVKSFGEVDGIKHALYEQLFRPVRWIETVQVLCLPWSHTGH